MAKVIVVDDESALGQGLRDALAGEGYDALWFGSAEPTLEWFRRNRADLLILDLRLPGMDGLSLLSKLNEEIDPPPSIVLTAQADIRTAVAAMKLGAEEFLAKPVDLEALLTMVRRTVERTRVDRARAYERSEAEKRFGLHRIIGECDAVKRAKDLVVRLASLGEALKANPPNVLITGPTGTGKDLLARAFHVEGPRSEGPFVHVNCAALPEALVESELFGHVKGAFTDAVKSKPGLFEVADGGTLYLDEISQLPIHLQAKLLTALETRTIRPVGGTEERAVNVALVAAMNVQPEEALAQGRLRQDLYHRLRVLHAHLPPLRERGGDLDILIEQLLARHCERFKMPLKTISDDAREALREYDWPGNVRELSHWLESAVLLSGKAITKRHLPIPRGSTPAVHLAAGEGGRVHVDWSAGPIKLEDIERQILSAALDQAGGNLTKAARLLGLTRYAMRYRAGKFSLIVHG